MPTLAAVQGWVGDHKARASDEGVTIVQDKDDGELGEGCDDD
jgi:hypothetical protein